MGRRERAGSIRRVRRHRRRRRPRRLRRPDHTRRHVGGSTRIDEARLYPLTGPIGVNGAEPGDTLAIEAVDLRLRAVGDGRRSSRGRVVAWTTSRAFLKIFDLSNGDLVFFREDIAIPIESFLGTMGVCLSGARMRPIMPPGIFGGNIDTRQLTRGATLFLPVQVPGALFSCGDGHAAQGDGEVCVTTAVETSMEATLRFVLDKGRSIPACST